MTIESYFVGIGNKDQFNSQQKEASACSV